MNSIERMEAAINLNPVDQIPNAPFYEAPICEYFGPSVRAGLMDSHSMVDVHLKALDHFQFDWAILGMNLIGGIIPEALGCEVVYPEDSLPQITVTSIKSAADVDKVARADLFTAHMDEFLKGYAELAKRLDGLKPMAVEFISPFSIATRLRGTNEIMADMYQQPELVADLQEALVEKDVTLGKAFIEAGAEYIFYGADMECPLLISPDHYRDRVHPATSRVINELAAEGGKILPHMCGPIVDTGIVDMLLELDIQGIMPGNLTQMTVLKLKHLKNKVGERICIFDNLNPNTSLLIGTPEEVEEETRGHLEAARGMAGYIFSTSGTSSLGTTRENYEAMNRVVLNFR
jgi:uroporphyrinogen decarboxylase